MINLLDNLLRDLLLTKQIPDLTSEDQIRFQPPDDTWRTYVSTLTVNGQPANALNLYLVDLRDNRKLRSNERIREIDNGIVTEEPVPSRLDCHYLISAWSPAQSPQIEPALDEHLLLYNVAAVLMQIPLNPSRIYPPNSPELSAWARFQSDDLPTVIAPTEGYLKLSEFWHSMGQNSRLKPVLYLIVTLPVALIRSITGPIVTTRITEYWQLGQSTAPEIWIQIGGFVLDTVHLQNGAPTPVTRAWVQLATLTDIALQTTETDELGRFTFNGLKADRYRLKTRATGFNEKVRDVDIPTPSGEYNLNFP